ncbi:ATP-dependent RNA helicase DeaD [Humidesulfovibrio mexicanus]|uniref:ATP-dependent RNA helicase DeaD n=1 Tax=Humidesulfovibrio mexicanus TaxID=147047 RepID=A0A239A8V9_9BACT|nr:DEAD/DEAH box helicase [Humidesulfovibrio mexicanus]SNR92000.1 ATP-dependent RNA helicase DeaD [Humidesulfovibrio mexicanus]
MDHDDKETTRTTDTTTDTTSGQPEAAPTRQYVQAPGLTQVQKALLFAEEQAKAPRPEAVGEIAPEDALPEASLDTLPQTLREACTRAGWNQLMPVQEKALPYMLQGRDIMVQARTGSGKTGAFLLPLLGRLKPAQTNCQALILVPTRELAQQVAAEAATLFAGTGVECVAVYGGVGYGAQLDAFKRGAQIVVGTPGRVLDHLLKRSLSLADLSTLIFDEADRMLSIGFYPDMKDIQRYLPRRRVHSAMFSATFPQQVLRLAQEFLTDPGRLSLSEGQVHIADMTHAYYEVPSMGKDRCLMRIIEMESPESAIIFCNTKADVHYLTAVLSRFGYNADELSADLTQSRRDQVLSSVREGRLRFLIATDVAGRGIDIPGLSHVILYSPPENPESYIHRAGRTGRAGAAGTVISLVDVMQKMELMRISRQYGIKLEERALPTEADLAAHVAQRLSTVLEAKWRAKDSLEQERARRYADVVREMAADEHQALLLAMLLDGVYQNSMHVPPPRPEGRKPEPQPQRQDEGAGSGDARPGGAGRRRRRKR